MSALCTFALVLNLDFDSGFPYCLESRLALIQLSMHWQVLTGADAPDGTEASGASEVEEECGGNRGKATGLWMKLDL